jgi:hypothetical protein
VTRDVNVEVHLYFTLYTLLQVERSYYYGNKKLSCNDIPKDIIKYQCREEDK